MPRFHFDLVDTTTVADQGGQLLEDSSMAIQIADRLAQELSEARPELRGKGFKILVTDADGEHVHEAALDKFRLV
ncbi:hypothetical protein [Bradyrhizobium sp. RDT46]|jgi:hypothetical protein|uniref:DUF6894 family protein n=1 Tax=Bradyrhizobium sp. RDT46 TaxID=3341829 RepID=UPI0035C76016